MAEINQFGSAQPGSAQTCTRCESLLMDVLDGAASVEDQQFFDAHVASCAGCSQTLADARRGGAWLGLLRDPRPEPPAALFERILAQTSGVSSGAERLAATVVEIAPRPIPIALPTYSYPATSPQVLPFRLRGTMHSLGQTMLQPRLAMTAAMAFFSIALTLNLTGVHVSALRVSDLRPSNLRRQFYEANAHVVRYCDNLRVVYELEARTHDLQRSSDNDSPVPATRDDGSKSPDAPPEQAKPKPKPGPGTSRREPPRQDGRMVAASVQAPCTLCLNPAVAHTGPLPTTHLKGDLA